MRIVSVALAGLMILLTIVAFAVPWWTADMEASAMGAHSAGTAYAGPFDNQDGLIEDGQATLAGILVLLSLLSAAAAVLLWLLPGDSLDVIGLGCIALAALLLLVTAILAVATWPDEDMRFWDESSASAGTAMASMTVAAGIGWYLALAATASGLASGVVQVLGLRRAEGEAAA